MSCQVYTQDYEAVGEVFGYAPIAADMFVHAVHDQQAALNRIRRCRSQKLHASPGIIFLYFQIGLARPREDKGL